MSQSHFNDCPICGKSMVRKKLYVVCPTEHYQVRFFYDEDNLNCLNIGSESIYLKKYILYRSVEPLGWEVYNYYSGKILFILPDNISVYKMTIEKLDKLLMLS